MTFSDELIGVLKKQIEIFKALEKLAYEKTDTIINNQLEVLEGTTKIEEGLINKIGQAEESRLKILDSWGLNTTISMTEIIEKVPDGKEELMELKQALVEVLDRINERNRINDELIEDNLEWLDFNMNLISNAQTSTTYGKGKPEKGVSDSLFDRKV